MPCRLRDRDDERLRAVLIAPAPRLAVDELRGELAVVGRHGQQLHPAHALGRSALVDVDVGGGRRDHGPPSRKHRLQADDVRSRAVEDGEGLDLFAEAAAEHLLQARGVLILAVGDLMPLVRRGDGREHFGVDAGVVVRCESPDRGVMQSVHRPSL